MTTRKTEEPQPKSNQYLDRNGNIRTIAPRHRRGTRWGAGFKTKAGR